MPATPESLATVGGALVQFGILWRKLVSAAVEPGHEIRLNQSANEGRREQNKTRGIKVMKQTTKAKGRSNKNQATPI